MSSKLFFIKQIEDGVEQHRWLHFIPGGTFTYSDFYENKAGMVRDCIATLQVALLNEGILFEDMKPGMVHLLKKVAADRYQNETNYFDECFNENHEPGCLCEGLCKLEEVEHLS